MRPRKESSPHPNLGPAPGVTARRDKRVSRRDRCRALGIGAKAPAFARHRRGSGVRGRERALRARGPVVGLRWLGATGDTKPGSIPRCRAGHHVPGRSDLRRERGRALRGRGRLLGTTGMCPRWSGRVQEGRGQSRMVGWRPGWLGAVPGGREVVTGADC